MLIAGLLNLAAQTGSQANLWASVLFYQGGLAESHHGLAPAYLRGILAVLRFDWGWGWALGSLSCGRSSCADHLQCFGGPRDVLGPLPEGSPCRITRTSPSLESRDSTAWHGRSHSECEPHCHHCLGRGRSLAFYTEIIGFQQIQRPNFDRHGAWLTMGNLELHLIKGVPNAPSGRDLIVSHIALDTNEPHKVLEKLLEYEVPFRQNISVPDPQKARENLVEAFESSEGKITQYFVRDPDGYYLELCNCDVLTAFCLFKENAKEKKPGYVPKYKKLMDAMRSTYNESGQVKASPFRFPQLLKTTVLVHRLVRKARGELNKPFQERVEKALEGVEEAAVPDGQLLEKFIGRQKTYCDICQGFSEEDLASALCKSGNYAPTALLLLAACRQDVRVFFPPQYLLSEGGRIKQQVMAVSAPTERRFGAFSMFASKPFEDADRSAGRGRRKSGLMLSLAFEDDAKMQSYLRKSYSFGRSQTQASELEEEEICV